MWQPRCGHYAKGKSALVGLLYPPLIKIDRKLVHKTYYLGKGGENMEREIMTTRIHPSFIGQTKGGKTNMEEMSESGSE